MTAQQMERLQKAIVKAFTRDELQQCLRFRLEQELDEIVEGKPRKTVVFEVLRWAEREGQVRADGRQTAVK